MSLATYNTSSNQHWFFKYKLYHIPFWLVYSYAWWAVQTGDPVNVFKNVVYSPYTAKFLFYVIFYAAAAYFNLYFLIPRFLEKGRYVIYILCLIATIFCAAALIVPGYSVSVYLSGIPYEQLFGAKPANFFIMLVNNPLQGTAAAVTLAMSIKLTKNWIQSKRRQQALETEKLETELKFLKYQFNPHFLFNSINSIFFLIHKNPDKASASLAKFSDLLRHQLYECNDNQISLSKEITYLQNFIELERLRQNDNVEVTFNLNTRLTEHVQVAPFILMTFVENAFKHVSRHTDRPNSIQIQLGLEGHTLYFNVVNTMAVHNSTKDVIHYGGIGLQNVKRRLDLVYAGKYHLDIQNTGSSFKVALRLQLTEYMITKAAQEEPVMFAAV